MKQSLHLSKAPIIEAVIDVRAQTPSELSVHSLSELGAEFGHQYEAIKPINVVEFEFKTAPGQSPQTSHMDHGISGFRYESEDRKQICQCRRDGFTFSRLSPYSNWNEVFAEASRLYRIYCKAAEPEEVARIGVRYINRIELPIGEVSEVRKYLTAAPILPSDADCILTGFLSRFQVQVPNSQIAGNISQTLERRSLKAGHLNIILDLDFYDRRTHPPEPEALMPRFGALREAKNRYFFASITQDAVDLFT